MLNGLDPDQDRRYFGPDLGPNCLQILSADDNSRQRVSETVRHIQFYVQWWLVGLVCKRSIQEAKTILYDFFKKSELLYVKGNCFFLLHIIYIGYIRVNQYTIMFLTHCLSWPLNQHFFSQKVVMLRIKLQRMGNTDTHIRTHAHTHTHVATRL